MVAVKIFNSCTNPRVIERERMAFAKLPRDKHLIFLLECHTLDTGEQAFVLPLYRGGDLFSQVVNVGGLGTSSAFDVARQLASALSVIHHAGFVHLDVKLENVFVRDARIVDFHGRTGHVVLGDYGYVTHVGSTLRGPTGTSLYCSPEHMAPSPSRPCAAHPAADAWSLGVLLFAAASLYFPFEDGGGFRALRDAVVHSSPAFDQFPKQWKDASPALVQTVRELLRKDPGERRTVRSLLVARGGIEPLVDLNTRV